MFSFFWNRVSEEWLSGRTARLLFAGASIIIVAMTVVLVLQLTPSELEATAFHRVAWGTAGVLDAVIFFFLW